MLYDRIRLSGGMATEGSGMKNLLWLGLILLFLAVLVNGCTPPVGTRKVTAWGIWAAPFGTPIGIGYWHSEHGINVQGEESAKPEIPHTQP